MYLILCVLFSSISAQGLCPTAKQPSPKVTYLTSTGYPRGVARGGECKFTLKVNYGNFVKLEKVDNGVKCGRGSGITVVERINVQGKFKSGDVAPVSRFESKGFCGAMKMPGFVSSDVEIEIIVNFNRGDKFKIGYKSVAYRKGPTIPRTKAKLTTRPPPTAPVTQMPPWVPPAAGQQPPQHPQHHQQHTPQSARRPPGAMSYSYSYDFGYNQAAYGPADYNYQLQPVQQQNYGVHHQLPPTETEKDPREQKKGHTKLIMVFGGFGVVVILVMLGVGGFMYKKQKSSTRATNEIPLKN